MENLKNQIRHKKNELMRVKNECRQKEDNLRSQIDTEYKNKLARNEYLKNKEYEERKRIKENYEKQEREIKKNNIIKKNKNELNRFLIDNQQKSEIIKNKNEHEHQITLQKLEDKFNLDMKHLNNIQDEKIKELNSEELINNKKAENKILELNLEKKKIKNNRKFKRRRINEKKI